jgi:hydrogenase nickel incorporation protein HypA/HybF
MHELSLAVEIHRLAREAVAGCGPGQIEIVRIAVGELSAVEPDILGFAWEATVAGTEDAASRLDVDFRPARQTCRACGEIADRAPGSWLRLCPRCGDTLIVSGGDDLDVLSVVFEEMVPVEGAGS